MNNKGGKKTPWYGEGELLSHESRVGYSFEELISRKEKDKIYLYLSLSDNAPKFDPKQKFSDYQKSKLRKEALEFKFWKWTDIGIVAKWMCDFAKRWYNVYCNFNWTNIYSVDVKNIDDVFILYEWRTKQQHYALIRAERERQNAFQREEVRKNKEKIPSWIAKGAELVDSTKKDEWKKFVEINGVKRWFIIEDVLELLQMIEEWKNWKEINDRTYQQLQSGYTFVFCRKWVVYFSKNPKDVDKNLHKI